MDDSTSGCFLPEAMESKWYDKDAFVQYAVAATDYHRCDTRRRKKYHEDDDDDEYIYYSDDDIVSDDDDDELFYHPRHRRSKTTRKRAMLVSKPTREKNQEKKDEEEEALLRSLALTALPPPPPPLPLLYASATRSLAGLSRNTRVVRVDISAATAAVPSSSKETIAFALEDDNGGNPLPQTTEDTEKKNDNDDGDDENKKKHQPQQQQPSPPCMPRKGNVMPSQWTLECYARIEDVPISLPESIRDQVAFASSEFVSQCAQRLYNRGAVSMRFDHIFDSKRMYTLFRNMLLQSPFFRRHPNNPNITPEGIHIKYVGGQTGLLATPDFDHHMVVRVWRDRVHALCAPVLGNLLQQQYGLQNYKLLQYPDQLLFLPKNEKRPVYMWQRDGIPLASGSKDKLICGWLNMSDREQHFTFLAKTHHHHHHENDDIYNIGEKGPCRIHLSRLYSFVNQTPNTASRITIAPGGILLYMADSVHRLPPIGTVDHDTQCLMITFLLTDRNNVRTMADIIYANGRRGYGKKMEKLFRLSGIPSQNANRILSAQLPRSQNQMLLTMDRLMLSTPLKNTNPRLMYPKFWTRGLYNIENLMVLSATISSDCKSFFHWVHVCKDMRKCIHQIATECPLSELGKAVQVLAKRGDMPGSTLDALIPSRVRLLQPHPPALLLSGVHLSEKAQEVYFPPYTDEHLSIFMANTQWTGLCSPWIRDPSEKVNVKLFSQ
jgi:hypothetical protein